MNKQLNDFVVYDFKDRIFNSQVFLCNLRQIISESSILDLKAYSGLMLIRESQGFDLQEIWLPQ